MATIGEETREEQLAVLRFLSDRARNLGGWRRRGVTGWVFADEFPHGTAVDHLRDLAARGLVAREDVCDPARKLALHLNRITQPGEAELASRTNRAAFPLPVPMSKLTPADRETIYLLKGTWPTLRALAAAAPDEWLPITAIAAITRTPVFGEELTYLVGRNLVEVRRPPVVTRQTPLLYRATALGRQARLRSRNGGEARVQVRVRGIQLRCS